MRILVTGKDGQVGHELSRWARSGWEVIAAGRQECDLRNPDSVRNLVRRIAPDVIVNAAAYTAVDQAEREQDLCFAVNAEGPRTLAEESSRINALLIHYSTDYVFDGEKPGPYLEEDAIAPLNVYGASKAAGEKAISETAERYLILRTTWVFGSRGKNFARTVIRLAGDRPELRIVADQFGAPTSAAAIAGGTRRLVEQAEAQKGSFPSGIYHMTAEGSTSWCGFAQAIVDGIAGVPRPRVVPITTAEFPTPARRPKNSVLANEKFEQTFGFRLTPWTEQLQGVLSDLVPSSSA